MDKIKNPTVSDLNLLPMAIGLLDDVGVLAFANDALLSLCPDLQSSQRDGTLHETLVLSDRQVFQAGLAAVLGGQAKVDVTVSLLSGASKFPRLKLTLYRNASPIAGCQTCILVRDVSSFESADGNADKAYGVASNAEQLVRLRALIDNLPQPIWFKDPAGRYVLVNRPFELVHGLTEQQILGRRAQDLLGPADGTSSEEMDRLALASTAPVAFSSTLPGPDGMRYFEVTKVAVSRACGEPAGIVGYAVDVTASKQRQDDLDAALREQRLIFEHTSVGIVFVRDGVIVRANDAFGQILGYAPDELLDAPLSSLPVPSEGWLAWSRGAAARSDAVPGVTKPADAAERTFVRRDGRPVTCSVYSRVMSHDDSSQGMIYALIDVTAQRESDRQLAETRSLLDGIIEHLPSVVAVRDAETGRYVHYSRSAERLTARPREEVIGRTPADVYPAADAEEIESIAKLVMQTGQRFSTTTRVHNQQTGVAAFAQRTTIPIQDENGKIRYIMNLGEDITDKLDADKSLRESETRFRQFASNVDQALFWSDPDRSVWQFQNRVFEDVWGFTRQQLLAQPNLALAAILDEDREIFRQAQQHERDFRRVDVEFRVNNPQRGLRWVRMRTVTSLADDRTVRVFGTIDDVTERRMVEQERLEQVVQQRDKLIREVHHRIKNNLQGVVGLLQHTARTKPGLAEELREVSGQISAIAQVHGLQMNDSSSIPIVDLVKAVVLALSRAIGYEFKTEIENSLKGWALQESEGVACALVINELAANAVHHGKGESGLRMYAEGAAGLVIEVWNSGLLPTKFEPAGAKHRASGLGLIRALVPRKGGQLKITESGGVVSAKLTLTAPAIYAVGSLAAGTNWE